MTIFWNENEKVTIFWNEWEITFQRSKDGNYFHQKNIWKGVITAALNIEYHTCNTKFCYLPLVNDSNGSFQKLPKITGTCKNASLL